MKKMQNLKKITAVLMAVLMIALTVPVAFAADEPVKLTRLNVYQWPKVTGEVICGQFLTEAITIVEQGIVTTDGTADGEVIPGTFTVCDRTSKPSVTTGDTIRLTFNFTPDDTSAYTEIIAANHPDVTAPFIKVTPVFVDEENDPVVATPIKSGEKLSQSVLSGGQCMNPIVPTEPSILEDTWRWENSSEIVTTSGYHQAWLTGTGYNKIYKDVWVEVEGSIHETEIINLPEIEDYAYDGITTYGDLVDVDNLVAVDKETREPVNGTFSYTSLTAKPQVGMRIFSIKFTPDDTENYLPSNASIQFNVSKGIPSWKDGITPVVTVPYGTTVVAETFHNLRFDGTLVADENLRFDLCDAEGNFLHDGVFLNCGTYTDYQLRAASNSTQSNWQPALLPITIIVEPGKAEITVSYNSITNKLTVSATSRYLYGTFDIYIDGELVFDDAPIERYQDTQRYVTDWKPADISGNSTHDIKVVYNKADNDNAFIASDYEGTFDFTAKRNIIDGDKSIRFYKGTGVFVPGQDTLLAGQEITAQAGAPDFRYWKITDAEGNDVELEFVKGDMNSREIIFVMPEFDINIDYVCQFEIDRQEAIDNCDCLCHNDNPIVQFFWRIILFFMNLFKVENVCDCGYPHGS